MNPGPHHLPAFRPAASVRPKAANHQTMAPGSGRRLILQFKPGFNLRLVGAADILPIPRVIEEVNIIYLITPGKVRMGE
jgi:hypothetical protein